MTTSANFSGTAHYDGDAPARFEARNITVRYGGVLAVDDCNLTVGGRSIVGLVGPNGAGKSTLFNAMSGMRLPNSGSVFLDGREITRLRPESRARLGLARTFQEPELFSQLTVRQHLSLSYRLRHARRRMWSDVLLGQALRKPDQAESTQVERILEQLNLTAFTQEQAGSLPIGIRRVVEIARAVIAAPRVLLLDEPSAGLDNQETTALADALVQLVEQDDLSVVLVEHDVSMVLRISEYVYVLDFGECIASGTPAEIADDPLVQSAYLGTAI